MSTRNPWDQGLMVAAGLLATLTALFVVALLVALAFGVELAEGQNPEARYFAWIMLAAIAVMSFVIGMSARWKRRHS